MPKSKKTGKRSGGKFDFNDMVCGDGTGGVEVDYEEIKHMTEKAALLIIDGDEEWVPKSQIIAATKNTITVTDFIARERGWD